MCAFLPSHYYLKKKLLHYFFRKNAEMSMEDEGGKQASGVSNPRTSVSEEIMKHTGNFPLQSLLHYFFRKKNKHLIISSEKIIFFSEEIMRRLSASPMYFLQEDRKHLITSAKNHVCFIQK